MRLTYAVGDIHGRFDLLVSALGWIDTHAAGRDARILFLGDYIDRGPDSRAVVETLMGGRSPGGLPFVCLMGNHEALLLAAPNDLEAELSWLRNGGRETLESYGGTIPADHLAWMAQLQKIVADEHRIFVHAGLHPRRPVEAQTENDLLWIREPFLRSGHDFGRHVVHGHTPNPEGPELERFRTNLDVGAFWTGRLAIGVFEDTLPGRPLETVLVGV